MSRSLARAKTWVDENLVGGAESNSALRYPTRVIDLPGEARTLVP